MGWGKAVILIFGQIIVLLLLVPSQWMERVTEIENRWLTEQMGSSSAAWVREHSESIYVASMVDSGLMQATYNLLLPTREQKAQSGAMANVGTRNVFPYVRDRLNTTFLVIYQSIARAVTMAAWAPFAALLLLPAIIDGVIAWRIRKTTFDFASPTANHYALLGISILTTAMIVTLLAPWPIPPLIIPVAILMLCPALYIAVSHTSKRI